MDTTYIGVVVYVFYPFFKFKHCTTLFFYSFLQKYTQMSDTNNNFNGTTYVNPINELSIVSNTVFILV